MNKLIEIGNGYAMLILNCINENSYTVTVYKSDSNGEITDHNYLYKKSYSNYKEAKEHMDKYE